MEDTTTYRGMQRQREAGHSDTETTNDNDKDTQRQTSIYTETHRDRVTYSDTRRLEGCGLGLAHWKYLYLLIALSCGVLCSNTYRDPTASSLKILVHAGLLARLLPSCDWNGLGQIGT